MGLREVLAFARVGIIMLGGDAFVGDCACKTRILNLSYHVQDEIVPVERNDPHRVRRDPFFPQFLFLNTVCPLAVRNSLRRFSRHSPS